MKLRVLGFIALLAGSALFIMGCPGKSSPGSPTGATPTPTQPTYTFEVLNSACMITYSIGSTSVTVSGNCAPFPNTVWITTPWDYSFTSSAGVSYSLTSWAYGSGTYSTTVSLKKNGSIVTTSSGYDPQSLSGTLP